MATEFADSDRSNMAWRLGIGLIIIIFAVVVTLLVVETPNQEGESREESQEVSKDDSRDSDGKRQEDLSASEWSEDTSDVFGRSIRIPKNGSGQPMGSTEEVDNLQCESENEPSKLTIERVHSAETLWSETQGPGRVTDEGVPAEYAYTPEGAILSAWNGNALVQMGGHDVALRTLKQQFTGGHAKEAVETLESNASAGSSASVSAAAPEAFRITSCRQDRVIGDVAVPMPTDAKGNPNNKSWMVIRVSSKWENGDWKAELDEVKQSAEDEINNIDGWEQWKF